MLCHLRGPGKKPLLSLMSDMSSLGMNSLGLITPSCPHPHEDLLTLQWAEMEPILSTYTVFMSKFIRGFHTIPIPAPPPQENAGLPWYQGLTGRKEGAVRTEDRGIPDGFGSVLNWELALDSFCRTHFDSCHFPLAALCQDVAGPAPYTGHKHTLSSASVTSLLFVLVAWLLLSLLFPGVLPGSTAASSEHTAILRFLPGW